MCEKIQEEIKKLSCFPWISLSCIGLLNLDTSVNCDYIYSMFRNKYYSHSFIANYITIVVYTNEQSNW